MCDGLTSRWLDAERDRLAERRLDAIEERIELDLALGDRGQVISELRRLTAEHPLRERLRGLLMLALYRSGRQADALDVYRQTRRVLHDELGIEPEPALRGLHQQILAGDPALAVPPAGATVTVATTTVDHRRGPAPAQLPHALADFVGRETELERLNDLLAAEGRVESTVVITALDGTAG